MNKTAATDLNAAASPAGESQFLNLNDKWALAADGLQWILQRRGGFDKRRGKFNWSSVAFVATRRDILFRALREYNVIPDAVGQQALAAVPETFPEWRASRFEGVASATSSCRVRGTQIAA